MSALPTVRLTREVAARLLADTIMVATALLLGLILRFLWIVRVERPGSGNQALLADFLQAYIISVWWLLLISLSVFILSGFYTHGRAYRGRYKALVITQAISLSYVIFGFVVFLFRDVNSLPRAALFLAWFFTLVFLISARLWSMFWTTIIRVEQYLYGSDSTDRKTRNVLVIGGAGYIGSALLPKLLDKGYHVRLLDILLFGSEPIAHVIGHPHLEIVQADFRQVDQVVAAMRGIDAVIHLGAIVGDPACALDEDLTIEVNLMATRMIAEVAKGSGVNRFVFASTCSVYGASDQVLDEHSTLNPVSLYARSKIASEKVLTKMANERFAPVILRFGTIYGLSGRTRFDLVVNLLTAKAIVDGQITVFGGDQWRPFLHVNDAAVAIFKALEAPLALVRNQIFNVGSDDQNYTIQHVGEIIHRLVPTAQFLSMGLDSDCRNYRVNFSKIRNILEFAPMWTVEQGVQQVIQAITCGKVHDYQDIRYSNAKFLGAEGRSHLFHRENGWAYDLLNETLVAPASLEERLQHGQPLQVRSVGAE